MADKKIDLSAFDEPSKKTVETTAQPSNIDLSAFDGLATAVPQEQPVAAEPFQTNPLKAALQGVTSGYTYNFADNIGEALGDTGVKERYNISKREQPLAYAFGNLAVLSPNFALAFSTAFSSALQNQ